MYVIYDEAVMKEATENVQEGMSVGGATVLLIRYTDDKAAVASSQRWLQYLMEILIKYQKNTTKVRTDSSTEFRSNPIFIDRIRMESAAGSNPILIIQICTALDLAVDFNEHVTAFTANRTCMPSSDFKGGYCSVPGTAPVRSRDVKLVFSITDHLSWRDSQLLTDHRSSPCMQNAGCVTQYKYNVVCARAG